MELRPRAERFCALIGRAESSRRDDWVDEVVRALSELVAAAAALPEVEPTGEPFPHLVESDDRRRCFELISDALGDWNAYGTTLSPIGPDAGEGALLSLADAHRHLERPEARAPRTRARHGPGRRALGMAVQLLHARSKHYARCTVDRLKPVGA